MGKINVALLQRIKAHILEEPKRYDQGTWGLLRVPEFGGPPCGTVACLGGWALELSGEPLYVNGERVSNIPERAAELIGLDSAWEPDPEIGWPFGGNGQSWPSQFAKRMVHAANRGERAQVAADYIDFIIEKKGEQK